MSNKTQLQTNNVNLDALITRVNAAKDTAASLPEAGGSVETCTIDYFDAGNGYWISVTRVIDGCITTTIIDLASNNLYGTGFTIDNVVKGTKLLIIHGDLVEDYVVEGEAVYDGRIGAGWYDDYTYSFTINGDCHIEV